MYDGLHTKENPRSCKLKDVRLFSHSFDTSISDYLGDQTHDKILSSNVLKTFYWLWSMEYVKWNML